MPRLRRDQVHLLYADALTAAHDHAGAMAVLKPLVSRWPYSCAVWARFCRSWTSLAHANGAFMRAGAPAHLWVFASALMLDRRVLAGMA